MHSIRPPEYFPGLPFWALVLECDEVVLADHFRYSRQSFQNRAKLRTPDGWQWISVPLTGGGRGKPIADVEIDNTVPWRGKHLRALQYNYRSSPYFEAFEDRFVDFFSRDWRTLGDLTIASIHLVCDILDLPPPSTGVHDAAPSDRATELILESDLSIDGAAVLFFEPPTYRQNFDGFEPGMSVLDTIFNLGPETNNLIRSASAVRS